MPSDRTGPVGALLLAVQRAARADLLKITVKRTVDGYGSNWIGDNLQAGDTLPVLPPSGIFTPADLDADFLLFAGGSGITPVISIARTALAKGTGKVVLVYANRDEASVIFAAELAELAAGAPRPVRRRALARVACRACRSEHMRPFAAYFTSYTRSSAARRRS